MEKWIIDIEIFPNFLLVKVKKLGENTWIEFYLHEGRNDLAQLLEFLGKRYTLIGYNILEFDAQILEFIWQKGWEIKIEDIYEFAQSLIDREDRFDLPYNEWDLSFRYIDLYKINHYDNPNRRTSLKWLEYTTRRPKVIDLPVAPGTLVPKTKYKAVASYCGEDITTTEEFYNRCKSMVDLRYELAKRYGEPRIINMSDSSIGAFIFEYILTKQYGFKKAALKKGSVYDKIHVKDCLVDYIQFESPEFNHVLMTFEGMIMTDVQNKGIKGEEYSQTALFDDMVFVYGSGGVHACYKAGEYSADDEYTIMSVDVKSYYPNLSIANNFYPKHIGTQFCSVYKGVYDERQTYEKGSADNYAFKIALNGVYGKSNAAHGIFRDPAYTLKITVNGQLLLTMLAEGLSTLGRLLMVNTDGMEIRIHRSKMEELKTLCTEWEILTGLELEFNEYKKIVIRDVNNYLAVDVKGKSKRKGIFEIYEDYTEEGGKPHQYHKSPGATVISEALYKYYVEDIPVEETINQCNNIHEFCYGIKKQKNFDHWLITAHPDGVVDIEKNTDKVLRYYIAKGGANIFKFWKDDRKNNVQGINRGQLVKLAMNIKNPDIQYQTKGTKSKPSELIVQYDVDRDYYIRECYELIDLIASNARDTAYNDYMKEVAKLANNIQVTEVEIEVDETTL